MHLADSSNHMTAIDWLVVAVWVMAPDGKHLGTIVTREFASNVTSGPDAKTLYITADMLLLRVKLK